MLMNRTFWTSSLCFAGGFADSDTGVPHLLHLWLSPDPGGRGAAAEAGGARPRQPPGYLRTGEKGKSSQQRVHEKLTTPNSDSISGVYVA